MTTLTSLLPMLTAVSLFLFIFSAERAWLPRSGTTEWIVRTCTPKAMTADTKLDFKIRDIFIFIAVAVVFGGILILTNLTSVSGNIPAFVYTALFMGIIYLVSLLLTSHRVTAVFAAVIAASDLFLLVTFGTDYVVLVLIAVFVFMTLFAVNKPLFFIPAGIFLGITAFFEPCCVIFALLPLAQAVLYCVKNKNLKAVLLYILFILILPAAVYCGLSLLMYGSILIIYEFTSLALPTFFNIGYCAITALYLIFTAIHIFKDKSFTALFISVGLVLSAVCLCSGINLIPLFAGFTAAYLADIIIKRGKNIHRVFCIIHGIVMLLPILVYAAASIINM